MVYLIGTNHWFQYKSDLNKDKWSAVDEFALYLKHQVERFNIQQIAEEFNEDYLKMNNTTYSTAQIVAKQLHVEHLFCDPSLAKRKSMGIPNNKKNRVKNIEMRERLWLKKLAGHPNKQILFICGADHLGSFSKKLAHDGIDIKVLSEYWGESC